MSKKEEMVDVSIIVLSYCHEKYIAQALESILNQETDLYYEVLVEDFADTMTENASNVSVEKEVIADMSLRQALDALKPKEREVVHLKIMGEMTFQEIADVLKVPLGTVTWRYQNAIQKLRRCGYE